MTSPRRLLAVTMLVTAALALSGHPASAAPGDDVTTNVFLHNRTLPVDGPAIVEGLPFHLSADEPGWANEVTLTIDASAASAVAEVDVKARGMFARRLTPADPEVKCSTTGAVTRCTIPGPHQVVKLPDDGLVGIASSSAVEMVISPKPGAAVGDIGTLTVTARADDGPTTTKTATVRIGQGVDVTAVDPGPLTVAPGGSVALRPQVRNTGPRAVKGLVLEVYGDAPSLADTNFGNCVYDWAITCTFDTTLESGGTYGVSAPFTVKAPRDAAMGSKSSVDTHWLPLADWQDWEAISSLPGGRQGTGAKLRLAELTSTAAADVPQTDINGRDNRTDTTVTVTGGHPTDVAAVGATITGQRGDTRTIKVGIINHGTGTLHYPLFFNNIPRVTVSLPPGVTVVRADNQCWSPFSEDSARPTPSPSPTPAADPTPPEYYCYRESVPLRPGQQLSFAFTVRIDADADAAAEGSVTIDMNDDEDSIDQDAGNNSASIRLNLGGPADSISGEASSENGGAGGGLPVTGTTTATLAGAGSLLVLLGIAITVAVRRRPRSGE